MSDARTKNDHQRTGWYAETGRNLLTPAQERRRRHKNNHAKAVAKRASDALEASLKDNDE